MRTSSRASRAGFLSAFRSANHWGVVRKMTGVLDRQSYGYLCTNCRGWVEEQCGAAARGGRGPS
eukprot:3119615-Prymnesium_polylepis.1